MLIVARSFTNRGKRLYFKLVRSVSVFRRNAMLELQGGFVSLNGRMALDSPQYWGVTNSSFLVPS